MLLAQSCLLVLVSLWSSSIVNGKPFVTDNIELRTARETGDTLSPSDTAEYDDLENPPEHRIDIRSPQEAGDGNTIDQGAAQGPLDGGFGNNFQGGLGQLFGGSGVQNGFGGFGNGFGQAFSGGGGSGFNFEQVGGELIRGLGNILGGAFTSMASNRRNSFFGNLF